MRFTGDVTAYGDTSHRYALRGLWMILTLFQWMPPDEHFEANPECYVWFDWSWRVQFHDVAALYKADNPGKDWDIYASLRFEGPADDDQADPEAQNRFYVDRVVLVEVEE